MTTQYFFFSNLVITLEHFLDEISWSAFILCFFPFFLRPKKYVWFLLHRFGGVGSVGRIYILFYINIFFLSVEFPHPLFANQIRPERLQYKASKTIEVRHLVIYKKSLEIPTVWWNNQQRPFDGIQNCPFTHLTVRREIKSFESDVSTPYKRGSVG